MYREPPEPEEPTAEEHATVDVVLKLDHQTLQALIVDRAAWRVLGSDYGDMADKVRDEVTSMVRKALDAVVREEIATVVREAIDQPFQPMNRFGEPEGDPVTLRQQIQATAQAFISGKTVHRDYGGRAKGETAKGIVEVVTREVYRSELEKPVAEAVAEIRQGLERQLATEINTAVARLLRV